MSRLASSTSHPLVHLTLALLYQTLNRWQILQNQTYLTIWEAFPLSLILETPQAPGGVIELPGGPGCFEERRGGLPHLAQ